MKLRIKYLAMISLFPSKVKKFCYLSIPLTHFKAYLHVPLMHRQTFNSSSDVMLKIWASRTISIFWLFVTRYFFVWFSGINKINLLVLINYWYYSNQLVITLILQNINQTMYNVCKCWQNAVIRKIMSFSYWYEKK